MSLLSQVSPFEGEAAFAEKILVNFFFNFNTRTRKISVRHSQQGDRERHPKAFGDAEEVRLGPDDRITQSYRHIRAGVPDEGGVQDGRLFGHEQRQQGGAAQGPGRQYSHFEAPERALREAGGRHTDDRAAGEDVSLVATGSSSQSAEDTVQHNRQTEFVRLFQMRPSAREEVRLIVVLDLTCTRFRERR